MNHVHGRQLQEQSYTTAVDAPEIQVSGATGIWPVEMNDVHGSEVARKEAYMNHDSSFGFIILSNSGGQ